MGCIKPCVPVAAQASRFLTVVMLGLLFSRDVRWASAGELMTMVAISARKFTSKDSLFFDDLLRIVSPDVFFTFVDF